SPASPPRCQAARGVRERVPSGSARYIALMPSSSANHAFCDMRVSSRAEATALWDAPHRGTTVIRRLTAIRACVKVRSAMCGRGKSLSRGRMSGSNWGYDARMLGGWRNAQERACAPDRNPYRAGAHSYAGYTRQRQLPHQVVGLRINAEESPLGVKD